ncbi:nicotinic acid mononucleotide adenylyltransferase [Pararhodobacter marinus]|uniref:Probable nicotinate-nucleotide adenylyltransferase n=1 Tax=Pararhodobacter marinus TaxID=2184063 RepID=A0A2U2C9F9_9RHOB|nr:nicotinate-nucleotide adenylyltransferase [Pararhodobacter marinus]PWE28510.1 nicotinic acid mononucleotide adenylyltransferase [Pararhodobacter marinus]
MARPWATPGQVIGLLGGSFDPPHEGHVHLTREALKRLGLDRVWWLVSPGNPIKANPPAPLADRVAASRRIMRHPAVTITDLEARFGTRATVDTLAALQRAYPLVRFVWLMGADNLAGFHQWDRWPEIMARVPVAVFARPGQRMRALHSRAAQRFEHARIRGAEIRRLGQAEPPAWAYLDMPMRHISSTQLRAQRKIAL